jgi:hypothetical protein
MCVCMCVCLFVCVEEGDNCETSVWKCGRERGGGMLEAC